MFWEFSCNLRQIENLRPFATLNLAIGARRLVVLHMRPQQRVIMQTVFSFFQSKVGWQIIISEKRIRKRISHAHIILFITVTCDTPTCQSVRVPVEQSLTLIHVSTAPLSSSPDCGENTAKGRWMWELEVVSSTDPDHI